MDGQPVDGSPFVVQAKKGCDPKRVKAYGPGLERGTINQTNTFTIETRGAGVGPLGLLIEGSISSVLKQFNHLICEILHRIDW